MQNNSNDPKPSWILIPRLVTFVLISGIVIFGLNYPSHLSFFYFAYSLITLLLPAIFILRRWISVGLLFRFFPPLQTILEIVVVSSIVYTTGNINSAFSGLFILTIISAALFSKLAGTLGFATLVSIAFSFIIWYGMAVINQSGSSLKALENIFQSRDAAFYTIFLHILTFYLVAFISGFLVERLKVKDRELADTSKALRLARLETDDILKHLNSGLLTIDKYGKIIFFNRAAEEILSYKEDDLKGSDFRAVFESRMPDLAENLINVLKYKEHSQRNEVNIIDGSGKSIPLGISTSLLADDVGDIRGVIAIFQDLTETKKLEEKMRAADKLAAVGELSAAIAHEIRNPLAAISGSIELLKSALEVSNENQRLMDLIMRESNRLNNILSDFLLYARADRLVFNRIELCRLVSDVLEVIKHQESFHSNIDLKFRSTESFFYVYGDENHLKQILINLVINAYQAIDNLPGEISLIIEKEINGKMVMKITDDGPGIDPQIRSKIFDPFFSTKKDGTGLGLAIVQRLCSGLGIDIAIESEVGQGTTFILQFNQVPENQPAVLREKSRSSCA
jgi:two-component system sensor histidine kinase PilS (NtrC family)